MENLLRTQVSHAAMVSQRAGSFLTGATVEGKLERVFQRAFDATPGLVRGAVQND